MTKKICFIVQDGASIKNYLYSDIFRQLKLNNFDVSLMHSISVNAIKEAEKLHGISINNYEIPVYKESPFSVILRELVTYSRLRRNKRITNNQTILTNWNPRNKGVIKKFIYKVIEFFGYILSINYSFILKTEEILNSRYLNNNDYRKLIKEINPDIIFNTNQRLVNAACIVEIAKKMNILTIGAIFSWDNLPKGNLFVKSNKYFVWSLYMKNEILKFYPELNKKNIVVSGTPQFDFYFNERLYESKDVFFKRYNLNVNKKVICFSGDDLKTSPFDEIYLHDIAKELMKIEENKRPQILFRPCPVDLSGRYDFVLEKYPNLIKICKPIWNTDAIDKTQWNCVYPMYEDVKTLVNVILHCDTVVNIGSTMALDFSVLNKSAVYLNYNTNLLKAWSTEMIYSFQHFKSMPNKNAVFWINNKEDISKKIIEAMNTDSNKEWLKIVTSNISNSTRNIIEKIKLYDE